MKPIQMFSHWEQVHKDTLATVDMFSENELIFTPFKGSWPIGQIMLHIADCEDNWLYGVVQHQIDPWIFYKLKDHPAKAQIRGLIDRAHKRTITYLEGLEDDDLNKLYKIPEGQSFSLRWIIWHVLEHEIHHRGELSLALGMLGHEGLDV